ncbi:MAG: hypothetical protein D6722_23205 [Bacteroidetes bacterium]|nr:MAG: hypothetical protein D6722_23205 [Bacteroidota bacterium]
MTPKNDPLLFAEFPPVSKEAWLEKIANDLKGKPLEKLAWRPAGPLRLSPVYTAEDLDVTANGIDGTPGVYPYRRGNRFHADGPGWQIVQEIPVQTGPQGRSLLRSAQSSDIPAVWVRGQTSETKALEALLSDLDITHTALHLDWPAMPSLLASDLYVAIAQQDGTRPEHLTGTLVNDPLSRSAKTGKTVSDFDLENFRAALDAFGTSPHFRACAADFSYIHEQGGHAVQELAFALSTLVDYLVWLGETEGRDAQEEYLRNLAVTFATGSQFFLEVAKWRAFRVLLAKVLDSMGFTDPDLQSPFLIARTAYRNLSRYDRHTNLLRNTTEAISAVFGGVQAVVVSAYDRVDHAESDTSLRLARNIQHLMKHEAYLDQVQDPAGGSYYVEQLTDQLGEAAWTSFQELEAAGGFRAALASGQIGQLLAEARTAQEQLLAKRRLTQIGVNNYPHPSETLAGDPTADDGRQAVPFEQLRLRADAFAAARGGQRLRAFLLLFGDTRMRNARSQFARNLIGSGGWEVLENSNPQEVEASLQEAIAAKPEAVVLCSADPAYFEQGPELISRLRAALPDIRIILAGKPEGAESLPVDDLIYAGLDAQAYLASLLQSVVPA